MDFDLSLEQQMMVDTAEQISARFGPEYWREKDEEGAYPADFIAEIGAQGFFGLPVPTAYGGMGLGLTELTLAMEALCRGGGGGGPALGYLFGLLGNLSILHHGNDEQKSRYLPDMASGAKICAFALSEPDAGTNSLNITTFARREGDEFVISGGKWFITNIENSNLLLLVARTEKPVEGKSKAAGISLFLVDLPQAAITYTPIPKHGFNYYKSNTVFIEELRVHQSCLLGQEGRGFYSLLATLNPERVLIAAGAVGTARLALSKAVEYAKERKVFDAPIGSHQGVQHPLAAAHAKVEAAWLTVLKAVTLNDRDSTSKEAGAFANMAKFVAVEACIEACYHAMQTYGGAGYAREYHQERWWREAQLFRLAPITQQMTLNYIGQHVLGLPKSY
jgi:acyl-CoA dehydrogenase|tara:strand:- start:2199 stop:3374 length:1176 start_codon:yes stop_codon:yes gene_type:complete